MLTRTSETAIKFLIYLALHRDLDPVPPHQVAEKIDASPTYLAKITRMLVKSNILRSYRGALGGVTLARDPANIMLLDVVEACQGLLIGNYCDTISTHPMPVCAFHEAMMEVQEATLGVLGKWSIQDMADRPGPDVPPGTVIDCKINLECPSKGNGCAKEEALPNNRRARSQKTTKN